MALTSLSLSRTFLRYSLLSRVTTVRFASSGDNVESGPYPKTPEERAVAAKKYGMRVEDYEPYPDDGLGWGDYPKFPAVHEDYKDPHGDWDFPSQRRNYGETPHIDYDFLARSKPPGYVPESSNVPLRKQGLALGGTLLCLGILLYIGQQYKYFQPVGPKQFPYNDLWIEKGGDSNAIPETPKHYSFQGAD